MDFKEQLNTIADKIRQFKGSIKSEEATKNAFILPFLKVLDYDPENPTEVDPECKADDFVQANTKVDYSIRVNGETRMIFEVKMIGLKLDPIKEVQLYEYFIKLKTKIGILTDGETYKFYTDLERRNTMDGTPFFEFNLLDMKESSIKDLEMFRKDKFDIVKIKENAKELKNKRDVVNYLSRQFNDPSAEFIGLVASEIIKTAETDKKTKTNLTKQIKEQFKVYIINAAKQLINDKVKEQMKIVNRSIPTNGENTNRNIKLVKSEKSTREPNSEELEGLSIIASIIGDTIDSKRIVFRLKNYVAILLDDNQQKRIFGFKLEDTQKKVYIYDENKKEIAKDITKVDDIKIYAQKITQMIEYYSK